MLNQIKRAIEESKVDMPEIINLEKSLNVFDKAMMSAKTAISEKVMQLVQDGNVEELYKLRPLVEVLNSEDSSKIMITLDSNISNRRPKSVSFLGQESKQSTWRGVTEAVLEILYSHDKASFNKLLKNSDFESKHPYYAKSPENMSAPVMLGSGASAVYADAARITNNDFFYLKKTLRTLGHEPNDVILELDPNYTRKPVERNQKAENKDAGKAAKGKTKSTNENPKGKSKKAANEMPEASEAPKRRGRPKKNPAVESNTTRVSETSVEPSSVNA